MSAGGGPGTSPSRCARLGPEGARGAAQPGAASRRSSAARCACRAAEATTAVEALLFAPRQRCAADMLSVRRGLTASSSLPTGLQDQCRLEAGVDSLPERKDALCRQSWPTWQQVSFEQDPSPPYNKALSHPILATSDSQHLATKGPSRKQLQLGAAWPGRGHLGLCRGTNLWSRSPR